MVQETQRDSELDKEELPQPKKDEESNAASAQEEEVEEEDEELDS